MRALMCVALLMAAPAAQAAVWSASCTGQNQTQYLQTVGGDGYLHFAQSNGAYTSVKLKQSYYDGKTVCGSTGKAAANEVGAVCADNDNQVIRIVYGSQMTKRLRPEKAPVYCQAVVNVSD